MEWVQENWFFILFAALFIGMHFFGFGCGGHGHGKHGGHGGDEGHEGHNHTDKESSEKKGGSSCH